MDERHILGMLINRDSVFLHTVSQNEDLKRDFPGSPVDLRLIPPLGGIGLTPGLGTKIPHATRPGKKKERERDMKKILEPSQAWGPS